jgi:SAM-dependent methyltransferase
MRTEVELRDVNSRFYNSLWSDAQVITAERFNTWPLVSQLVAKSIRRLEVAPGLRPRLPLEETHFVDMSLPAVEKLTALGAHATQGLISALPFGDGEFDLVCAFDIVEHVQDEEAAFAELARVAAPGAALLLSVPLHESSWTAFDEMVGHHRRYEPAHLQARLARHGFTVEQSAAYGMQPRSSWLLDLGMWFLEHRRQRALWWYNHVFMPVQTRFQKPLAWVPGMLDTRTVDEVLLVCRKERKGSVSGE